MFPWSFSSSGLVPGTTFDKEFPSKTKNIKKKLSIISDIFDKKLLQTLQNKFDQNFSTKNLNRLIVFNSNLFKNRSLFEATLF